MKRNRKTYYTNYLDSHGPFQCWSHILRRSNHSQAAANVCIYIVRVKDTGRQERNTVRSELWS